MLRTLIEKHKDYDALPSISYTLVTMAEMKLSDELAWRGLIKDKTFDNIAWLNKPRAFYLGIDASADSLTVGNLAILMLARRLAAARWKAYLVMGGGTSLVGDPGGKNEERQLMSRETVKQNIEKIQKQVTQLFRGEKYLMLDNYDWLSKLKYVNFLREVGKHFSMTELMQRDFVVERMGEGGKGISYAEFSYSLIQGYDFWHLFNEHNVVMQIGGSDQWGNLISGVSLIRKKEGKQADALSMPLIINKSTGKKFGKSEDGAVWLDETKTSVYQFYQFWLNVDDNGVGEYLKIFTELNKPEIAAIMAEFETSKSARLAQKTLAYEVTKLVHGRDKADSVMRATETLFGQGDYTNLSLNDIHMLKSELPNSSAKMGLTTLVEVLVNTGLAGSNSEARRYVSDGAVYINGLQVTTDKITLDKDDVIHGHAIIRRGKNSQAVVQLHD